jgi:hypothetical protein
VFFAASHARAALDVALAVSPSTAHVGQPVEVLLRTFVPIAPELGFGLPSPDARYPVASGLWNVLYPVNDYPFDVAAEHDDGTVITVSLTRDPSDATLWRGFFVPSRAGTWNVRVRNFPAGSAVGVMVSDGPAASAAPSAGANASGTSMTIGSELAAGAVGLLLGFVGGFLIARGTLRRS